MVLKHVYVGCWVTTMWGPAVCVRILDASPVLLEGGQGEFGGMWRKTALVRYHATRGDGVGLWVLNGRHIAEAEDDPPWFVRFLREADEESRGVLGLQGPYGLD